MIIAQRLFVMAHSLQNRYNHSVPDECSAAVYECCSSHLMIADHRNPSIANYVASGDKGMSI